MTADAADVADALDPRDAEPPLADRRRPLGLYVVMALSVARILIELTALVGPRGTQFWDWVASGSNVPIFDAGSPVWWVGRGVIVLVLLATAASVVGLWRNRTWGWSLALILAGLILAVDIGWWIAGQPRYPGMFFNMIAVFYLNQRDVRATFLPSSL